MFNKKSNAGLTLPELLMAILILVPLFIGAILTFVKCMEYSAMAKNSSTAILASKNRMAQIDNTIYGQVFANYNSTTFTAAGLNGIGVTYVNNADPNLLDITISFCWRERNGRVIGEDKDLDGVLDAGEDTDGDNMIDSLVSLTTKRYNIP